MTGRVAAILGALLLLARPAAAQDSAITHPICMRAAPAPGCSAILLTNFGIHALTGGAERSGGGLRLLSDWGLLVNTGRHAAVGASWLLSVDRDGVFSGPMARVRLWRKDSSSWEIGLGHALNQDNDNVLETFGLIKWNPAPSVGLSLRPEWRRHTGYDCTISPPYECVPLRRGTFTVSAGIELGGVVGVVGSLASAAAGVALMIAYLTSGD
jgi:hypothetical protein